MNEEKRDYLPDISIIVACYNQGKWLERCVRSLSHQNGFNTDEVEILVIDDGSTDMTDEVLENLIILKNIRVFRNQANQGLPFSLNFAIRKARGRYVVRVDSDDYVQRNFLFVMKLFLDLNRHYQAVAVDYIKVDQFENVIGRSNCFEEQIACGILFRKECLFEAGLYNTEFQMREGHELRQRFEKKYKIARLEFPFYRYRFHDKNRTKNRDEVARFDHKLTGS